MDAIIKDKPKTLDEHREYLHEIVGLKLFFMHDWLTRHPDEKPAEVLRNRIDIYRKTEANAGALNPATQNWEGEAWQALEQPLLACHARHRYDIEAFEQEGFAILRPSIDARCERDFIDTSRHASYQCGSLRYNLHTEPTARVGFHIANVIQPRSIFANPSYLPCCFMTLMEHVEALYGASEIQTGTWLNMHRRWLGYFPKQWHDNMGPSNTDVKWNYGFWGQFISARGTYNRKLGDYFRKNREFYYYPRASYCGIAEMRRHLLDVLGSL